MSKTYMDLSNQFPDEIDALTRFSDVTPEYLSTVKQYYAFLEQDNLSSANALLEDNPALKTMIINAENLNKFVDIAISLERFYRDEVEDYLVNIVKYKGAWNENTAYTKYDVVTYAREDNIEAYMGIVLDIPLGILPTNTTYFVPMVVRGPQGVSGTGLSYRYAWSSIQQYQADDCVAYKNALWAAKRDNVGAIPQDGSGDWELVLGIPSQITVSELPPVDLSVGYLWYKEI